MPHADETSSATASGQTTREAEVLELLKLDANHPGRLTSRENSRLEYKQSFNWGSRATYAKTMAAFANNAGGFIVFGVKNSPHELAGLTSDRFNTIDPARITEYLNARFAPELDWEMFGINLVGVPLGVVAVAAAAEKPVVCVRDDGNDLREADIYYRYRGRSERIRYAELHRLMVRNRSQERAAFLKHLRTITRVGPENVGVLDLVDGELSGHRASLLVPEDLLSQIQFIREGRFAESSDAGAPTLRIVGEAEIVASDSLLPVRTIVAPMVVGQKELILSFLCQERPEQPIEYLKQACREGSPNMPVYHFARAADLTLPALSAMVLAETPNRSRLLARLNGALVAPVGSLVSDTQVSMRRLEILRSLEGGQTSDLLRNGYTRLFEAITHYHPAEPPTALLQTLASLVHGSFEDLNSVQQTQFRKAVAHLDEILNRDALPAVAGA